MKKINFYFTVIKIFMKNQMQDKTNIMLDVFYFLEYFAIMYLAV